MVALLFQPNAPRTESARRTPFWPNSPSGRLNIGAQVVIDTHRSGWKYALAALKPLHHGEGVLFDGFLEATFSWHLEENVRRGVVPYERPWVGVLHNPADMPEFYVHSSAPARLLDNPFLRESLPHCRGLFVLSEHARRWLAARVRVPVCTLTHPTAPCSTPFSLKAYFANPEKKLVQIGFWLRRTHSIKHLPLTSMRKLWIVSETAVADYRRSEALWRGAYDERGIDVIGDYEERPWLDPAAYDLLLSQNLAFLHLYDSSANNAVVECIVRATPLLVNPLPAVVEYLGADYPFYFENLDEAADKAQDPALVRRTHEYLRALDQTRFSGRHFLHAVEQSPIYRALPPAGGPVLEVKPRPPVDALADLRIESGAALDTRYVFVVCFRNAGGKIARCIESVLRLDRKRDFGVIVVDDASEDDGLQTAVSLLRAHGLPHAAVANRERKYYTRNLYNAVKLLVRSPDSVILELDGDDYLEDTDVLGAVEARYDAGALRTFGSFRCTGDDHGWFATIEDALAPHDMLQPWDLDACASWMHLKTFRKSLFERVPLEYFWERGAPRWLRSGEDLSIHPKMVELAGYRSAYIDDVLYVFDLSGQQHALKNPDNPRYLVENLYRVPVGRYLGECRQDARIAARLAAARDRNLDPAPACEARK